MGFGRSGDIIQVGRTALEQISGKNPTAREAKETQRDWGIRKGEPIGVAVTVRGEDAKALLKRLLNEHIVIPGVKYDPKIGILGLGISVTLARPGYGIRKRSKHKANVGKHHVIKAEEAKDYLIKEFGVTVV